MDDSSLLPGCYSCDQQAADVRPAREEIVLTDHWRVAHAFNSALRGWLVVLPIRHVTSFTELSPQAADELGGLVRRCSLALESVTGCAKTYLMQFSEAEGFHHLHLHLVPRMSDQPENARGPKVFTYLDADEQEWISTDDQDALACSLRATLLRAGA